MPGPELALITTPKPAATDDAKTVVHLSYCLSLSLLWLLVLAVDVVEPRIEDTASFDDPTHHTKTHASGMAITAYYKAHLLLPRDC